MNVLIEITPLFLRWRKSEMVGFIIEKWAMVYGAGHQRLTAGGVKYANQWKDTFVFERG
jgi:hypothetical protein